MLRIRTCLKIALLVIASCFGTRLSCPGFLASTRVNLGAGNRVVIKHIDVGERVLTCERHETNKNSYQPMTQKRVTAVGKSRVNCYCRLIVQRPPGKPDVIECSPDQEFYLDSRKWVMAYELKPGDVLSGDCRSKVIVVDNKLIKKSVKVYALHVKNFHNFPVGNYDVIVHNITVPVLVAELSMSYGAAGAAGGSFFGPIGFAVGLIVGGLVEATAHWIINERTKHFEYKEAWFSFDTLELHLAHNMGPQDGGSGGGSNPQPPHDPRNPKDPKKKSESDSNDHKPEGDKNREAPTPVRTEPKDLYEQLALENAKMGEGTEIMKGKIKDPKYPVDKWMKKSYELKRPNGKNIEIHYWEERLTSLREGFKFKN